MSNSVIGPRGEINAINFYINIIINCLISSCLYTHRLINLSTFLLKKVSFVIDSGFYSNSQLANVQQTRDSGVLSSKLYIPHPLPKCFWDSHRKSTEKNSTSRVCAYWQQNSISVNNRDGSYINSAAITSCPILESDYTRHSPSMDGTEVHKSYPQPRRCFPMRKIESVFLTGKTFLQQMVLHLWTHRHTKWTQWFLLKDQMKLGQNSDGVGIRELIGGNSG